MLIGELADHTDVTARTLRFYEAEGLLPEPPRTSGGYRDYPSDAVERIRFVRRAQAAGLTLGDIGRVLAVRDAGETPCAHVAEMVQQRLAQVERRLEELTHTRAELQGMRERLEALDPTDCAPDSICAAVPHA